ncbi:MAG: tRNA preQ1(34) S-adenosylmethionine ribosyltransferase-isomerase QueA [Byssovorax sp.]
MKRSLLHYDLPPDRIASHPLPEREAARLLVVDPAALEPAHASIRDLPSLLPPGALLVVNDTRVVPARLLGHKEGSGGRVEIFLVRQVSASIDDEGRPIERWTALGRASKPLRPGALIRVASEGGAPIALTVQIEGRRSDDGLLDVLLIGDKDRPIAAAIEALGHMPLPPYMHRADEAADRERYQTVFARVPGAVAAPTAGLHLSEALLARLAERGIERAAVTLHVGLGTFQPVTADDLDDHPMHAEVFMVPDETAAAIARARARGAPVVAVGTTVVRALESAADPENPGLARAGGGETRLLIQPGYAFRVVDRLITNFHLPESTLLALVSAFAGRARVLSAYAEAIRRGYRFYSYGDAMLIQARAAEAE